MKREASPSELRERLEALWQLGLVGGQCGLPPLW